MRIIQQKSGIKKKEAQLGEGRRYRTETGISMSKWEKALQRRNAGARTQRWIRKSSEHQECANQGTLQNRRFWGKIYKVREIRKKSKDYKNSDVLSVQREEASDFSFKKDMIWVRVLWMIPETMYMDREDTWDCHGESQLRKSIQGTIAITKGEDACKD